MKIVLLFIICLIPWILIISSSRPRWTTINYTDGHSTDWYSKEIAQSMYDMYKSFGDNAELKPIKYKWGFLWRLR